jgi:hypothetical protein
MALMEHSVVDARNGQVERRFAEYAVPVRRRPPLMDVIFVWARPAREPARRERRR